MSEYIIRVAEWQSIPSHYEVVRVVGWVDEPVGAGTATQRVWFVLVRSKILTGSHD